MFDFKKFRKDNKFKQDDLAKYFGRTQASISRIENGIDEIPEEFIRKIRNDTSLIVDLTLFETEAKEPPTTYSVCQLCEEKEKRIQDYKEQVEKLNGQISFLQHIIETQCLDRPILKNGTDPP
jgi:transcriptional regulator with XRE-family HTH domain